MRFEFRLETPLRVARAREKAARAELEHALAAHRDAEAALEEGRAALTRSEAELAREAREGIDASVLASWKDLIARGYRALEDFAREVHALEEGVEEARLALAATRREVNTLEDVRHRESALWRREVNRREQRIVDDVVSQRALRARRDEERSQQ